ncbi:MAG: alpha-galactosidase, partial [Methylococcales bacterium]|nr:alpha-galactosidase [Methylococcales bacterium]
QPDGRVRLTVEETNDLGSLTAGATFDTVHQSITIHNGDFYDGVEVFGRMLRGMGLLTQQYNAVDYEPHWDSFGLEERAGNLNPGDSEEVNKRLFIPQELGLEWVAIDSGWDDGTGSCLPNSDIYADEAEFVDWLGDLHSQGFNVSLWFDPGFGDEVLLAAHPDWFIKNENGTYFQDDWDRYAMDPTVTAALDYVEACVTKLVTPQASGGWGVNRFFLDGTFLVPPDYSGRHTSPHETELAGDAFYRVTYLAARAITPDFPLEFCPCGGPITAWIAPYFSMVSTSDPDVMVHRPHEVRTKLYKALLGADAPVNGDHIEGAGGDLNLDMDYMFPLVLGLGDVYQTYFWDEAWRTNDPLGVGDKALYQEWFGRYEALRLS